MANEVWKLGIQQVLSLLDDNSLLSLAATVSQGLLKNKITTREDAFRAIFNFSSDPVSVLNRKIITKGILLNYLHENSVPITLPATKTDLIQKIVEFWTIQSTQGQEIQTDNLADSDTIAILARQFAEWFYSLMNSNDVISSDHFYPDSSLIINVAHNGQISKDLIQNNPQEIVEKLFLTKMKFHLVFNPNLTTEGVQGWIDPHGLAIIMACGSLHADGACVGVFEQRFAIVRDPFADGNWKIRRSELNLRSDSGVVALPTLKSCNLLSAGDS